MDCRYDILIATGASSVHYALLFNLWTEKAGQKLKRKIVLFHSNTPVLRCLNKHLNVHTSINKSLFFVKDIEI